MENANPDQELYEVMPARYFEELIEETTAEKARLAKAKATLESGDMLNANIEFLDEHLDGLLAQYRADLEAQRWQF